MNLSDAIEPVTALKNHPAELIRRAQVSGHPIMITQNGKATAVLVDVESYERQRAALLLLRFLACGEADRAKGQTLSHAQAKKRLGKKLKQLGS